MKTKIGSLAIGILVIIISVSCNNQKKESKTSVTVVKENKSKSEKTANVESSFVCYVNNAYMGIEQIPVEVDGKIYYGCCEGCVDKLKNMRETRFAIDPLTGNEVDKALAYIALKPNGNGEVLYFESEKNYLKYF
jgi:YHS domain-containing protein